MLQLVHAALGSTAAEASDHDMMQHMLVIIGHANSVVLTVQMGNGW